MFWQNLNSLSDTNFSEKHSDFIFSLEMGEKQEISVRLCSNTAHKSLSIFNIACPSSMDLKTTIHTLSCKNLTVSSFRSHQNRKLRQNNSPKHYILIWLYGVLRLKSEKKIDTLRNSNFTQMLGYFWIKLNYNRNGIKKIKAGIKLGLPHFGWVKILCRFLVT